MIEISGSQLDLGKFTSIVLEGQAVIVPEQTIRRCTENFQFLRTFSSDKVIYGINTGFGPMAQYYIAPADHRDLQYNLIRSHASGAGNPLPYFQVRAMMLARMNSLASGYSGIHPGLLQTLALFLNHGLHPYIPEHGGVGASGDLVQLAHLGLTLIGEGEMIVNGVRTSTETVLAQYAIPPFEIHCREGLAIMNGTSCMTGIGLLNLYRAKQLLDISLAASATLNELVETFDDHYSEELNSLKLHPGQQHIAARMQLWLADSGRVKKRHTTRIEQDSQKEKFTSKVQEYYSLRCVPQILGPVHDTIEYAEKVLVNELNSTNDNPVLDHKWNNVFHGGNFHGDYISLEMDKLRLVCTKLSMLAERQLNYLIADYLNEKFPKFLNLGKPGLNFGVQGMQFTATSTVAENQALSNSLYVHSIPTNADNQDVVSMGTNAALLTSKVIENGFQVLAIEWMALVQAFTALKDKEGLSTNSTQMLKEIANISPPFVEDLPKYIVLEHVISWLQQRTP